MDVENLLVSQPDTGEQALEICEILVRSGAVDVVVIDSVAALVPKAEIEGEMGDSHMGLQARLMSQALRKLTGAIARSKTSVIFINQLREKIGVMFGNPETTTGGKALKFYASLRLDIRRIGPVKEQRGRHRLARAREGGQEQGRAAVQAGRVRHHVRRRDQPHGLVVDIAAEAGIIEKSGAWYAYGGQRIGQGRENAKLFLKRQSPALMAEVEEKVKVLLGVGAARGDQRGRGHRRVSVGALVRQREHSPGSEPLATDGTAGRSLPKQVVTPSALFFSDESIERLLPRAARADADRSTYDARVRTCSRRALEACSRCGER